MERPNKWSKSRFKYSTNEIEMVVLDALHSTSKRKNEKGIRYEKESAFSLGRLCNG